MGDIADCNYIEAGRFGRRKRLLLLMPVAKQDKLRWLYCAIERIRRRFWRTRYYLSKCWSWRRKGERLLTQQSLFNESYCRYRTTVRNPCSPWRVLTRKQEPSLKLRIDREMNWSTNLSWGRVLESQWVNCPESLFQAMPATYNSAAERNKNAQVLLTPDAYPWGSHWHWDSWQVDTTRLRGVYLQMSFLWLGIMRLERWSVKV